MLLAASGSALNVQDQIKIVRAQFASLKPNSKAQAQVPKTVPITAFSDTHTVIPAAPTSQVSLAWSN